MLSDNSVLPWLGAAGEEENVCTALVFLTYIPLCCLPEQDPNLFWFVLEERSRVLQKICQRSPLTETNPCPCCGAMPGIAVLMGKTKGTSAATVI